MKVLTYGVCAIALLGIGLLWWMSPIVKPLPKPTGPYIVGVTPFLIMDAQRTEFHAKVPESKKIVGCLWYPAASVTPKRYEYLGDSMPVFKKLFAQKYHIPGVVSTLLWRGIGTHAYLDAPIASTQTPYPILLFSHGLFGLPSQFYSSIIETLVSHGYIVVSIDHPYYNFFTYYSDSSFVSSDELVMQFQKMRPSEQQDFQSKALEVYKADMKSVVDYIERLAKNPESIFYNCCDLTKLGAMGHSAGGSAAIEFCRVDSRCKVAIDLDGWYDHIIDHRPSDKPLLLLFGSQSVEVSEPTAAYLARKEITREQYYAREHAIAGHKQELCSGLNCSMIVVPNAEHNDFSDEILLKWPLRGWHAVESYATLAFINNHILHFLKTYLLSISSHT